MSYTFNRESLNIHLLLCVIAIVIGVLIYAGIIDVTVAKAAGWIIGIVAVLSAF